MVGVGIGGIHYRYRRIDSRSRRDQTAKCRCAPWPSTVARSRASGRDVLAQPCDRERPGAAAMRAALALLIGWLLVALVLLALDGRLGRPGFAPGPWGRGAGPPAARPLHARPATPPVPLPGRRRPPPDAGRRGHRRRARRHYHTSPATTAVTGASEPPMSAAGDQLDRDGHDGRNCDFAAAWSWPTGSSPTPRAGSWPPSTSTWMCSSTTPSPGSHRAAASESGSRVPEPHSRSPLSRGAHIVSSASVVRSH
jgi:hypothetical protein